MKFSFVLLTWNRYKFLEKCLEALIASIDRPEDCEIIVMDNGSTDETPTVLQRYKASQLVRVVTRKKNYGLEAYKKLFALVQGEYIVVVDDDVLEFPRPLDSIFTDYMLPSPIMGSSVLTWSKTVHERGQTGTGPVCGGYPREKTVERPTGAGAPVSAGATIESYVQAPIFATQYEAFRGWFSGGQFKEKTWFHSGIIREAVCFHATGPEYARQYGHLDREIQKYAHPAFLRLSPHTRSIRTSQVAK